MCGIAGVFSRAHTGEALRAVCDPMTDALAHRGPDDRDVFTDGPVALGHRRLAILDLSPEGRQPMRSASGRLCIVFNGEVYNHGAIRRELESVGAAPPWRGGSDTETMLAAIEAWGLDSALSRFVGMFAFALWDRAERLLTLVRDRLGIKPLYAGFTRGGDLLFGSELKALMAHPAFERTLDTGALALFMRHGYVPAPHCIFSTARKLMPGEVVSVGEGDLAARRMESRRFWSAREVIEAGRADPFRGTPKEAADELERLLSDAVSLRMIADVPLGAFLSGGVDSSTVVALMQAQSARPVRTFTVGYADASYDEARHAREVARHLGTDHTELTADPKDALAVIPTLPEMYDEPFADASQIPTFIVSRLTRGHVTVALSGDGGDELFGGYNRHAWAGRVWSAAGRLPFAGRRAAARALSVLSPAAFDALFSAVRPLLPRGLRVELPGDKLGKLAEVLPARSREDLYLRIASHWKNPERLVPGAAEPPTLLSDPAAWPAISHFPAWMMALDLVTYLPDDILTKVDRASMAVALEARVPILDHRVAAFAWRLPDEYKIAGGVQKKPLRDVLYRHVPAALIERPKMGFGIPIDAWLRGPLRGWAEDLLRPARLEASGLLDARMVSRALSDHLSGRRNLQYHLWCVLMFEAWRERWLP